MSTFHANTAQSLPPEIVKHMVHAAVQAMVPSRHYSWLIIGGGLHGTHMAARLKKEHGLDLNLGILDPAPSLLHQWRLRSQATGMAHLRSPVVHHLDPDPLNLLHFAKTWKGKIGSGLFINPYRRPSLSLFDAHCEDVLDRYHLNECHISDKALRCKAWDNGVLVATENHGLILADRVILALGSSETMTWPDWAPPSDPRIQHIFDPEITWPDGNKLESYVVIGGGISAGQVALRLMKDGCKVHVVARHKIREHQFDSDPGWLGPKFLNGFHRTVCPEKRRATIKHARNQGSMPPDVRRKLTQARKRGQLIWHEGTVEDLHASDESLNLKLNDGTTLEAHRVFLATGLCSTRPGGPFVDDLVAQGLPISKCGYPLINKALCWHTRIQVMGALAELELGPAARNIIGARHAADRVIKAPEVNRGAISLV